MTTKTLYLRCMFSGLQIGKLEYETVAGHIPWARGWSDLHAKHPLFAMPRHKLLSFARAEWNRLAKDSAECKTTEYEDTMLRVCFLAVLHSLDSVQQLVPGLPDISIVQDNMQALFKLSYWQHFLQSKRFAFPIYRVSKDNNNADFRYIKDYLDLCFLSKEIYDKGLTDLQEQERSEAAERALKALRSTWVAPVTNKQLWRWVRAHLPAKYEADATGWMGTLFLGNERTILDFDKDEILLMIQIITSECPAGTGVLKAVSDRLNFVLDTYTSNKEAFEVDFEDYDTEEEAPAKKTQVEIPQPLRKDFPSDATFIRANALYYLQQRAKEQRK